jgi:hypothetical protein
MLLVRKVPVVLMWLILIAHSVMTACVPVQMLLLSQHDHIVIGKISAEQWVAHQQWHLRQVNGHFVSGQPDPTPVSEGGRIISTPGCGMGMMQAFYVTVRGPQPRTKLKLGWVVTGDAHPPLAPPIQSAHLPVPHPPPRSL